MSNVRRFSLLAVVALVVAAVSAPGAQAAWSSVTWTLPTTDSQLAAASCVSTTFCVLTGLQSAGTPRGLTYKFDGGSTYTSIVPATTSAELYGTSCTSTTFCLTVGTDYATATPAGHAEKFSGTAWSNVAAANPTGSKFTELNAVSCTATTNCWAVGRYQTTINTVLLETFNGTSLTQNALSAPAGSTASQLNGVSCSASNACTAVGWYESALPRTPLIYRYNGTTWAQQTTVVPSGTTFGEFDAVSCPSATSCHAVGYYLDSLGVQHALAETWNNTAWSVKTVSDPTGGQDAFLSGVSCTSSTVCEAVGGYTDSTNLNTAKLAEGYNGTSWSQQTDSLPANATDAQHNAVSCLTSSSFCRAVGFGFFSGSTIRPVISAGP